MREITATELGRNLRRILDLVEHGGEDFIVLRNRHPVARITTGAAARMSALEAMGDLYRTLQEPGGVNWPAAPTETSAEGAEEREARGTLQELVNPWDT